MYHPLRATSENRVKSLALCPAITVHKNLGRAFARFVMAHFCSLKTSYHPLRVIFEKCVNTLHLRGLFTAVKITEKIVMQIPSFYKRWVKKIRISIMLKPENRENGCYEVCDGHRRYV